eukprot:364661-Chlamydomonas_euryale.AAC.3
MRFIKCVFTSKFLSSDGLAGWPVSDRDVLPMTMCEVARTKSRAEIYTWSDDQCTTVAVTSNSIIDKVPASVAAQAPRYNRPDDARIEPSSVARRTAAACAVGLQLLRRCGIVSGPGDRASASGDAAGAYRRGGTAALEQG